MTSLPRQIRIQAAVREHFDILAASYEAEDAFDAGEFSGPGRARSEDRQRRQTCIRHRITDDDMEIEMNRQIWGDDPMGDWHGRNE